MTSKKTSKNTFISFSYNQSSNWKNEVVELLRGKEISVDYSEKEDKSNLSDETIWEHLEKKIKGSSTTIILLSKDFICEGKGEYVVGDFMKSGWIYKEIDASLRDWENNRINGLLAIAKDDFYKEIFDNNTCSYCGSHQESYINNSLPEIIRKNIFNVKKEYKKSSDTQCLYLDKISNDLYDTLEDSYISIIKWSDFKKDPKKYIDNSFDKRKRQIKNKEFEITRGLHLK